MRKLEVILYSTGETNGADTYKFDAENNALALDVTFPQLIGTDDITSYVKTLECYTSDNRPFPITMTTALSQSVPLPSDVLVKGILQYQFKATNGTQIYKWEVKKINVRTSLNATQQVARDYPDIIEDMRVDIAELQDKQIVSAEVVNDELILTYEDTTTLNAGNVRGAKGDTGLQGIQGIQGVKGDTGKGIVSISISATNHLLVIYSDSPTAIDVGIIDGYTKNEINTLLTGYIPTSEKGVVGGLAMYDDSQPKLKVLETLVVNTASYNTATANVTTNKITLAGHPFANGDLVEISAGTGTIPTITGIGILHTNTRFPTANKAFGVVLNKTTNDFDIAPLTALTTPADITNAGTVGWIIRSAGVVNPTLSSFGGLTKTYLQVSYLGEYYTTTNGVRQFLLPKNGANSFDVVNTIASSDGSTNSISTSLSSAVSGTTYFQIAIQDFIFYLDIDKIMCKNTGSRQATYDHVTFTGQIPSSTVALLTKYSAIDSVQFLQTTGTYIVLNGTSIIVRGY